MTTPAETPARLAGQSLWPRDESVPLTEHTIGSLLTARAAEHPDSPALVGTRHGSGAIWRLTEHDLVAEAAVIGVPDEHWGESVAAVIRLHGEPRPGLRAELEAHCAQRLAPFKIPRHWLLAPALPVTPTGKVQKFKLTEAAAQGQLAPLA
jgi:hypothetical protein